MKRPRILVPIPTSFDEPYNAKCWPEYAAALRAAGGEPVQVALNHSAYELEALLHGAEGVLLPGSGADVDPVRYGHDRVAATAEADVQREQTDFALLEAAIRSGKPLLGVCFGTQSMNVFHGGTLVQDLSPVPVNHRAPRTVQVAHMAELVAGSRLSGILGDDARVGVNSSHHQAVGLAGEGLRVAARSPEDGVVEAIEGSGAGHWLVGVQWHPERTGDRPDTAALFADFVRAAGS